MVEFLSHKVVWQPSDNVPGWVRGSDLLYEFGLLDCLLRVNISLYRIAVLCSVSLLSGRLSSPSMVKSRSFRDSRELDVLESSIQ
jgi:hypothetical protein